MEVEPSMMEVERSTVQNTILERTHQDKTPEESPTTSAKASKLLAELLSYWYSEDARKPFCPKPFEKTTARKAVDDMISSLEAIMDGLGIET
jgi:hypothetical protein